METGDTTSGYSYVGAFFLANAAVLGAPYVERILPEDFSPRYPAARNRDEGAENAIAVLALTYARSIPAESGGMNDPDLITAITRITAGLPFDVNESEWNAAVAAGTEAWKRLCSGSDTAVMVDPDSRRLDVVQSRDYSG